MEKNIKTYSINGVSYQFDSNIFNQYFTLRRKEQGVTSEEFERELGKEMHVSESTIHSWRFGKNGPSSLDIVKQIADYFDVAMVIDILKKVEEREIVQTTERQKDSIKRIYDAVIVYLDFFEKTDGFNDLWHKIANMCQSSKEVESSLYDIAENQIRKIELILQQEYIELHRLDVYSELVEYVSDFLFDTFDGKLSYGYRFEAGVEKVDGTRDTVTTYEDYTRALKRINEIIEPYM